MTLLLSHEHTFCMYSFFLFCYLLFNHILTKPLFPQLLVFYTEGGTSGTVWDGFHEVFLRDPVRIGVLSTSCTKLACSHSHSVPHPPLFSLFTSVLCLSFSLSS